MNCWKSCWRFSELETLEMGQQNHPRSWLRGFPTDPGHLYNNFEGDEIVALLEHSDQVCQKLRIWNKCRSGGSRSFENGQGWGLIVNNLLTMLAMLAPPWWEVIVVVGRNSGWKCPHWNFVSWKDYQGVCLPPISDKWQVASTNQDFSIAMRIGW